MGLLVVVLALNMQHKTTSNTVSVSNSPSASSPPASSPGTASNSGDEAKSKLDTASPSSAASPTTASPAQPQITINAFNISSSGGGKARVSTQISGITSGNCQITLTDPNGKDSQATGEVSFSGTYYFCSPTVIDNITIAGDWSAALTVTSDSLSQTAKTTFKVTGQ
jgi:hypothetical protein